MPYLPLHKELKNWRFHPRFYAFETRGQFAWRRNDFDLNRPHEQAPKLRLPDQRTELEVDLTEGFDEVNLSTRISGAYISREEALKPKQRKKLDFLCRWLVEHRLLEAKQRPQFVISNNKTLESFLFLPFLGPKKLHHSYDKAWKFWVVKLNGIIFVHDAYDDAGRDVTQEDRRKELIGGFTGWKFKELITEKCDWEEGDEDRYFDDPKVFKIFEYKFGDEKTHFQVLTMMTVDAVDEDSQQQVIVHASGFPTDDKFWRHPRFLVKSIHCLGADIQRLIIGKKDGKKVLREICQQQIDFDDLKNKFKNKQIYWNPELCMELIYEIFQLLKDNVESENVLYQLCHCHGEEQIQLQLAEEPVNSVFPDWFCSRFG